MKRTRLLFLAPLLLALAIVTMGADSCGTSDTKSNADSDTDTGSGSGGGSKDKTPKPKAAKIGDSITITGNDDGTKMKVTVQKVVDPLDVGEFDQPDKGKRFVGVYVALKNVGKKTYSDSPGNGAVVITKKDEQGDSTIVTEGPCSGGFSSDVKIAPGARRQGCIPFEVPKGKLKTFQFTLDSGFGPDAAEWSLR